MSQAMVKPAGFPTGCLSFMCAFRSWRQAQIPSSAGSKAGPICIVSGPIRASKDSKIFGRSAPSIT